MQKHIEEGRDTASDLDYINMVACFPKDAPKGMPKEKYFGAIKKDDNWKNDGNDYILPLHPNCEDHFQYSKSGEVRGVSESGARTVALLALDHEILKGERKRAIESFIGVSKPLRKIKTTQAISEIDALENNRYVEFCIPLKHALKEHLVYLDKIEKKLKFARKK